MGDKEKLKRIERTILAKILDLTCYIEEPVSKMISNSQICELQKRQKVVY